MNDDRDRGARFERRSRPNRRDEDGPRGGHPEHADLPVEAFADPAFWIDDGPQRAGTASEDGDR